MGTVLSLKYSFGNMNEVKHKAFWEQIAQEQTNSCISERQAAQSMVYLAPLQRGATFFPSSIEQNSFFEVYMLAIS